MSPRRPPVLAFVRDLALSLPAFYVRKQHAVVRGDFVPVSADALRPIIPRVSAIRPSLRPAISGRRARVKQARTIATAGRASTPLARSSVLRSGARAST